MKSYFTAATHYSENRNLVDHGNISEYEAYLKLKPAIPGSMVWIIIEETCKRYKREY